MKYIRTVISFFLIAFCCLIPALGAEGAALQTYEETVAKLRGRDGYTVEKFMDCELCSVFLGRKAETPYGAHYDLTLVYKPGSPLGDGATVDLPLLTDNGDMGTNRAPSGIWLTDDNSRLRYTYYTPGQGADVYSVNLTTGEVESFYYVNAPFEEALTDCLDEAGYTVERHLEGETGDVVLRWRELEGGVRDYELYLFYKWGQPVVTRLLLPSTAVAEGDPPLYPTDRAPDFWTYTGSGGSLLYAYHFEEPLVNEDGQVLHEAGVYTYQATPWEQTVSHQVGRSTAGFWDVLSSDWFAPYVEVCAQEGLMKGIGEGAFSPYGTLSSQESTVLALRLHDLGQGGDGTFEKAPEDWGYAVLTLPDGTVREGYLSDGDAWDWSQMSKADSGHLCFRLNTEEEKAWGRSMDYQGAVLTLSGVDYDGELHLSGPGLLYFSLIESEDYDAFHSARSYPTPDEWWRDAWYYAEENGLEDLLTNWWNGRWAFAYRIAAVTDLPAVNEIPGLPDTGDPDVLELYRAGVLTGSDEYGTFHEELTPTRAEAAAICARILRPELRVSFSPKPLETYEDYTLTYLRKDGERPYGPHLPLQSMDLLIPDSHSLLRLDGVEVPVPEGYEVESIGEGLAGVVNWEEETYGLIDREGKFQPCTREEVFENPLLSVFHYDTEGLINGYQMGEHRFAFYNGKGEQVTPAFDWASFVDSTGAGFVGLDGNIYRIQFEK